MHNLKLVIRNVMLFSPRNCTVRLSSAAAIANRKGEDGSSLFRTSGKLSYVGGFMQCDRATLSTTNILTFPEGGSAPAAEPKVGQRKLDVSREDLQHLIKDGGLFLYDVREPNEIEETGIVPSAVNIPLSKLKVSLQLDEDHFKAEFNSAKPASSGQNVVFYGFSSVKSTTALEIAHKLGFKKAQHYPGGWDEWSRHLQKS